MSSILSGSISLEGRTFSCLTLFFADRDKMKATICELVGLNDICRYEYQKNVLLDCINSFNFEDCMKWQLQLGASFNS